MVEILTLVQTNKIEPVPIFLMGTEYWNGLLKFMKDQMVPLSMIDSSDTDLFTITDDDDLVVNAIKNTPIRNGVRLHHLE